MTVTMLRNASVLNAENASLNVDQSVVIENGRILEIGFIADAERIAARDVEF